MAKGYNPVVKKNVKVNAELKTMCDYTIIHAHAKGISRSVARLYVHQNKELMEADPLYQDLLKNNMELFSDGSIIMP